MRQIVHTCTIPIVTDQMQAVGGLKRRTKTRLIAWELAREGRRVTRAFKDGEHVVILTGDGTTIVTTARAEDRAAQMALEVADKRLLGELVL